MKLLIAVPAEGSVPLLEFFGLLDEKQRQKLLSLFALLLQSPAAVMREPYVKHFCIERYQALYELRAKSKNLVRIIFTLTDDGDILFLTPFIKRHKRNTMQALDRSLDCLTHIRDGSCSTQELSIKFRLDTMPSLYPRSCKVRQGLTLSSSRCFLHWLKLSHTESISLRIGEDLPLLLLIDVVGAKA